MVEKRLLLDSLALDLKVILKLRINLGSFKLIFRRLLVCRNGYIFMRMHYTVPVHWTFY